MTIYGGEKTSYGLQKDGFFVTCTKCGWHSKTDVSLKDEIGFKSIRFKCNHCGNEHEEGVD